MRILILILRFKASDRRWNSFCSNAGVLRKFHVIEGQIKRDQIAFYAFHSFLVEVQTKLATYVPGMRNSNLVIKIAGSSCRPQNQKIHVHFYGRSVSTGKQAL